MRAIILAAGCGSRLRPLTDNTPKALVPLLGRPLLSYQLEVLRSAGITDIHLVTGYLSHCFNLAAVTLHHNASYLETNMVHSLFVAESLFEPSEDLLICYGDIIYSPGVLASLMASTAPISISVDRSWHDYWQARMPNPFSDAETLKLTSTNRVLEVGRRPSTPADVQGQYIGLIKISAASLPLILESWYSLCSNPPTDYAIPSQMYMTCFLQYLIDCGWDIRASFIDNGWAEVDTISDLEVAPAFSGIPYF